MMMDNIDDTEHWANVAAEELVRSFELAGIGCMGASGDEVGNVTVAFLTLADAEAMMTLAVPQSDRLGSLYDRATASCVTLSSLAEAGTDPADPKVGEAIHAGWVWTIHPAMRGRRMGWHVSLDLPSADANQVTVNLNTLHLGVAL